LETGTVDEVVGKPPAKCIDGKSSNDVTSIENNPECPCRTILREAIAASTSNVHESSEKIKCQVKDPFEVVNIEVRITLPNKKCRRENATSFFTGVTAASAASIQQQRSGFIFSHFHFFVVEK